MALHVSPAQLREELTDLWHWISDGHLVVVARPGRPAVLLRSLQPGDRGQRISITSFRRNLHRLLREVQRDPLIVTVGGYPYFCVGPAPDQLQEPAEDRLALIQWRTKQW